jgi:hypothetical protein
VIFISPGADPWTESDCTAVRRAAESLVPSGAFVLRRQLKSRRFGFAVLVPDFDSGTPCALRLLSKLKDSGIGARIICDFGAVRGGDLRPEPELFGKLDGSADLVGFPCARLLATGTFAMEALYRDRENLFIPIGRHIRQENTSNSALRIGPAHDVFVPAPIWGAQDDDFAH